MSILEKKIEEVEEPLYSEARRKQIKQKEFREYLVNRGVMLSFIKCKQTVQSMKLTYL